MPDINLLQDTKDLSENAKKHPVVPVSKPELSKPEKHDAEQKPMKKPSSMGLWFQSLFRPRNKSKPNEPVQQPAPPKPEKKASVPPVQIPKRQPVDIFSGIEHPRLDEKQAQPQKKSSVVFFTGTTPVQRHDEPIKPVQPQTMKPTFGPPPSPSKTQLGPAVSTPVQPFPRPRDAAAEPKGRLISRVEHHGISFKFPMFKRQKKQEKTVEEAQPGVNLLPDELVHKYDLKKKLTTLGLIALAAALLIAIVDVSLILWRSTRVKMTEQKKTEVQAVITRIQELQPVQKKAIALRDANIVLRSLLDFHLYWTKFLSNFERYTLSTVTYPGGITIDTNGKVTLTGRAPDLDTIVAQIAAYQSATDFIQSASVNTFTRDEKNAGSYMFIIELSFVPGFMLNPVDTVVLLTQNTPSGGTP